MAVSRVLRGASGDRRSGARGCGRDPGNLLLCHPGRHRGPASGGRPPAALRGVLEFMLTRRELVPRGVVAAACERVHAGYGHYTTRGEHAFGRARPPPCRRLNTTGWRRQPGACWQVSPPVSWSRWTVGQRPHSFGLLPPARALPRPARPAAEDAGPLEPGTAPALRGPRAGSASDQPVC